MAMEADGMANVIITKLEAEYGEIPPAGKPETLRYYKVLSDAIIEYITGNAEVTPGSFSNSGGDVTGTGEIT